MRTHRPLLLPLPVITWPCFSNDKTAGTLGSETGRVSVDGERLVGEKHWPVNTAAAPWLPLPSCAGSS